MRFWFKKIVLVSFLLLFCLHGIIVFVAYKSTHYVSLQVGSEQKRFRLSDVFAEPRTIDSVVPDQPFETLAIPSKDQLSCWRIVPPNPVGAVIICHGYTRSKSYMLPEAEEFLQLGYTVYMFDFSGASQSKGNRTSIGFYEADQVRDVFAYVSERETLPVELFGVSMGAVAILKAIHDYAIEPCSVILECPFGTFLETVEARFANHNVPSFPFALVLAFWMGRLNGFDAFAHNPVRYAKAVNCPVLLMSGAKDPKVSLKEIHAIFGQFSSSKKLYIFPSAKHESYVRRDCNEWQAIVGNFLEN